MHETDQEEVLMENVMPEDLPREGEKEETPFVPSPTWKRIFAWVLFAVVFISLIFWLLNIAYPNWTASALDWMKGFM